MAAIVDPSRVGGPLISDNYHVKARSGTDVVEEPLGWSWNAPKKDSHTMLTPQRLLPYRQSRLTINPKYDSSDFSLKHHTTSSGLYDVSVEVKTMYKQHLVLYVSPFSKSNGQPIIGHPLSVKMLDDGVCDEMLSFSCYSSSSEINNMICEPKPRGRPPRKRSRSLKARSKRSRARRNGFLLKKIKTLSSLTKAHQVSLELKKSLVEKKHKGPFIACVPLGVVFSRINAALNNSPRCVVP